MPTPLRYTLTTADALAYERLPRALTGMQRATLYLWLVIAGILLVALPPELVGTIASPRFWLTGAIFLIVQWFIYVGARWWWQRSRARLRYPRPVEIELQAFDDRLELTEDGRPRTVPFDEIGMMLPAADYLFLAAGRELIIVPRAAFADETGMEDLVGRIDAYARGRAGDAPEADQAAEDQAASSSRLE